MADQEVFPYEQGTIRDQHQHQQPKGIRIGSNLELPPGFRFNPRDEEIITFYLKPKVQQRSFTCIPIGEIDLNKTEPSELPGKVNIGENQWFFFYQKDRKYRSGTRMNRATVGGYWKATGKDKEIYQDTTGVLIGMKKTLVFYTGRAPRGKKTSWVMHEYRLEGNSKLPHPSSSSTSTVTLKSSYASEVEWVVCRVFHKTRGTKKAHALPSYTNAMAYGRVDQSNVPMPRPLQLPMLPDFTMDPMGSYYPTAGASSLSLPPVISPIIAGMDRNTLHMNNALFGNSVDVPSTMPLYHQLGIGIEDDNGFMAVPQSGPSSMVFQKDTGMNLHQTNATNVSSMVSAALESMATMDMDGFWKY
ncbi:unnamed protein product [Urochloa decumbens]|uniref:NAC domain-containing protein n=1 Tax=Urochloa decumbens TaxID=240449 RepID=A0ABC9AH12_9POAL